MAYGQEIAARQQLDDMGVRRIFVLPIESIPIDGVIDHVASLRGPASKELFDIPLFRLRDEHDGVGPSEHPGQVRIQPCLAARRMICGQDFVLNVVKNDGAQVTRKWTSWRDEI